MPALSRSGELGSPLGVCPHSPDQCNQSPWRRVQGYVPLRVVAVPVIPILRSLRGSAEALQWLPIGAIGLHEHRLALLAVTRCLTLFLLSSVSHSCRCSPQTTSIACSSVSYRSVRRTVRAKSRRTATKGCRRQTRRPTDQYCPDSTSRPISSSAISKWIPRM